MCGAGLQTSKRGQKEMEMYIDTNGYYRFKKKDLLVHREIYKTYFKRIGVNDHIHHIDGDKLNNSIDNLISLPAEFHMHLHEEQRKLNFKFTDKKQIELALSLYLKLITKRYPKKWAKQKGKKNKGSSGRVHDWSSMRPRL